MGLGVGMTFISKTCSFSKCIIILFLILVFPSTTEAYDPLDPNGNITITWDIMSWTPDGYVAVVSIFNFQRYRHIQAPGWTLGWTWYEKEVIWSMLGAQTTEQGDCSRFKGNIPRCCKKSPKVVDLLPGAPYNQQVANCCKGGVINSWVQDPANAVSFSRLSAKEFHIERTWTWIQPARIVWPSKFKTTDLRRETQALMKWDATCTYSQFLSQKTPSCCVSLSAFYNETTVPCPTCSCGCQNNVTQPGSCVKGDSPNLASAIARLGNNSFTPLVQCTSHMCPVRIHWHVKTNYKEYWRVKITITNFNYRMNYTQWNLVAQHPNLISHKYSALITKAYIHDTAMLWGIKFYNDQLMQAGHMGNLQSELLFKKDKAIFTFAKGWAFPRRIYFNGDNCVMPPPDAYPWLPNSTSKALIPLIQIVSAFLAVFAFLSVV
ncbi:hypothetical protein MKX01_007615 [Papaver californicum]|nr:hypothetical protein MKX01_007615 [Papaver californicum]